MNKGMYPEVGGWRDKSPLGRMVRHQPQIDGQLRRSENTWHNEKLAYNPTHSLWKFQKVAAIAAGGESVAPERLQKAYGKLCKSSHAIDDFPAKLLGVLPAATGAGILFTAKDNVSLLQHHPQAIGLFGFVIALGLFSYEIYGIKKCAALIQRGRLIERQLSIEGQFVTRPHHVLWVIDETFATGLIYPAVLASWAFLFFSGKLAAFRRPVAAVVFVG